jgi:endonuclease YncB( thermonuclease family)
LRLFVVYGCLLLLVSGAAAAAPGRKAKPSCGTRSGVDVLKGVTPEGDVELGSGRLARLSGIRLPDEGPLREQALAWLRGQAGRSYAVVLDGAGPDRWGRVPVRLGPPEQAPADAPDRVDLAQALVGRGLAFVDPSGGAPFCRPDLFAVEAAARRQGLGLWADDGYKAISAAKTDRLRSRVGHFVLVEGRIRSVGERRQRTYLNFGWNWSSDFTVVIPKRIWSALQGRGLTGPGLTGRMVRVRGIVEDWQGPAMTVTLPEMLERVDKGPQNRQTTRSGQ